MLNDNLLCQQRLLTHILKLPGYSLKSVSDYFGHDVQKIVNLPNYARYSHLETYSVVKLYLRSQPAFHAEIHSLHNHMLQLLCANLFF